MAQKSQIGAVIGIEGWREYKSQIETITSITKNLANEGKSLEQQFKSQTKTTSDLAREKLNLQGQIARTLEKLTTQRDMLSKVTEEYKKGGENAQKLTKDIHDLAAQTNQTETELYALENRLKELPDSGILGFFDLLKENIEKDESATRKWGETLSNIGSTLTTKLSLPIVGGLTASTKAAIDWESALNGVRKTVDASDEEIDQLGAKLKEMALETGTSSVELAGLAQIAGQLGVNTEDIDSFVKTIVDLGIATDLTSEEAATALARITNITGDVGTYGVDAYEKLGSVIVHLGNNLATTEPEIVALANRMASTASIVGLTTPEIFALSAALSSVGISAEAGGSTVSQALVQIGNNVDAFSAGAENSLDRIAEVSGMSATQFADTWKNEPVKAFEAFVTGLGNLGEESDSVSQILDELGMKGIRESNMLKALAQAQNEGRDTTQLFTEALKLADQAFEGVNEDGTTFNALTQEANVRYGESATKLQNLKESVVQLGQSLGEVIIPVIMPIVENLRKGITWLASLDEGTRNMIVTIAALVAAIGPALSIAGKVLIAISNVNMFFTTLGLSLSGIIAPIGIAIAAIAGIAVAIKNWDSIKAFVSNLWTNVTETTVGVLNALWEGISTMGSNLWEVLKALGKSILDGLVGLVEKIVSTFLLFVGSTIPNFVSQVKQTWEDFKQYTVTVFTNAKNNVINIFTNLWQGLTNTVGNIKNTIVSGFQSAFSWITNQVSNAYSWGRDLIGNIISGITSKISSLVNAVSNVASTIWSYLHFSEPETGPLSNFNTWMPDMMKGMAKGIDDNIYLVDSAINKVAETLGNGSNSTNYGGVVINLNVPQGANGAQIVDEIETELANRTIRRKAVW